MRGRGPLRPALRVGDQKRELAGRDDRKAARLVAGIDVSEVGNPVARHVVMVERLAELLRGVDLVMDRAAGILFDRRAPILQRLLQRMRRRYPMRNFQIEGLLLRKRPAAKCERCGENRSRKVFLHGVLRWAGLVAPSPCASFEPNERAVVKAIVWDQT